MGQHQSDPRLAVNAAVDGAVNGVASIAADGAGASVKESAVPPESPGFSLTTKLLLSLVSLVAAAIVFVGISSVLLVREDKRAYTYQSQSTAAYLSGRSFSEATKRGLALARQLLATVDPAAPERAGRPENQEAIRALWAAQPEFPAAALENLRAVAGAAPQAEMIAQLGRPEVPRPRPEDLRAAYDELRDRGRAFVNLSRLGGDPYLGVLFADQGYFKRTGVLPVATVVLPLADFAHQLNGMNLTIATQTGRVLFDTDPAAAYDDQGIRQDPLFQAAVGKRLANGAQEYEFEGTRYLGSFYNPGSELVVLSRAKWERVMQATYTLMERFVLLGLMGIGVSIVFSILFAKSLTAPIHRLFLATGEVAAGNFDVALPRAGRYEIGALSRSFLAMSRKIADLVQESMAKVQLENELAIAQAVQRTLIPPARFADGAVLIASHYRAAAQCGGDWWGFFRAKGRLCVMIADATGHGFPSALITAAARSCFSVIEQLANEDPEFTFSPAAMLSVAHRVIYDSAQGQILMTCFAAVIDLDSRVMTYANAGHNPPWLFSRGGAGGGFRSLVVPGERLGESLTVPEYVEKTERIEPRDLIFFYTDGILENRDGGGEVYGKRRLRRILEANATAGPDAVIGALVEDYGRHNGGKPLDDDITLAAAVIDA